MSGEELKEQIMAFAPLIISIITLTNTYLSLRGMPCIEIDNATVTQAVSAIAGVVAVLWTWWKNNNVTEDAKTAQQVLNFLDKGYISRIEVLDFLNEKLNSGTLEEPEVGQEVQEAVEHSEELDNE